MLPYFKLADMLIYTYPLMMGIAWGVSFNIFKGLLAKYNSSFKKANLYFWGVFIASWVGAKIFFILTTKSISPDQYALSTNFWLGGGFVFYGGLIFGLLFSIIFVLITKQKIQDLNILVLPLMIGHGLGRIGCFLAGCCFGKEWNFLFFERYPVQLIEAFSLFVLSFYSLRLIQKKHSPIVFYIISYSILRFVLEFMRGDFIRGIWSFGLSTSQIISLCLIILSGIGLFILKKKQRVINKA